VVKWLRFRSLSLSHGPSTSVYIHGGPETQRRAGLSAAADICVENKVDQIMLVY